MGTYTLKPPSGRDAGKQTALAWVPVTSPALTSLFRTRQLGKMGTPGIPLRSAAHPGRKAETGEKGRWRPSWGRGRESGERSQREWPELPWPATRRTCWCSVSTFLPFLWFSKVFTLRVENVERTGDFERAGKSQVTRPSQLFVVAAGSWPRLLGCLHTRAALQTAHNSLRQLLGRPASAYPEFRCSKGV